MVTTPPTNRKSTKLDRTQSTVHIPKSIKNRGYQGGKKYTGHQTVFPQQYPPSTFSFPPNKLHQTLPIKPSRSPRHVLAIGQLDGGCGKVHAVLLLEGDGIRILRNRGLQHEGTVDLGLVHVSPRRGDIPCKPKQKTYPTLIIQKLQM